MGRLVLVSHGGRTHARAAAAVIQTILNPRIVITSPYIRARDTGAIIAQALNLPLRDSRKAA